MPYFLFTLLLACLFLGAGCGANDRSETQHRKPKPLKMVIAPPIPPLDSLAPFMREQMGWPRVKKSYEEKTDTLKKMFLRAGLPFPAEKVFFRAFKMEAELEMWGWSPTEKKYRLVKIYPFCNVTGDPGPKRQEGDRQTPEGFYHFNWFIPWSHRYLALQISYPNASDRALSDKKRPGKEILIHGGCTTEGCIPITDDLMKEVYVAALEAYARGQTEVPIHIFPMRLTPQNREILYGVYAAHPDKLSFWDNLQTGYDYFEQKQNLPQIKVEARTGRYLFQ